MKESWLPFRPDVALRVGQGTRDDADVDAEEQSAQSRHEQQKAIVTGFTFVDFRLSHQSSNDVQTARAILQVSRPG